MKHLYENIENIFIKGGVAELTDIVTAIDISLQNLSQGTETIYTTLVRYSTTNRGTQYEKLVSNTNELREMLYEDSIALNEMQNEIVQYQNKIYRYEDVSETACLPNQYMVERSVNVNVETSDMQFTLNEMVEVANEMDAYCRLVETSIANILNKKNDMANIWMDTQYDIFSEFIDEVCLKTVESIKMFDEYIIYLDGKIKELV